MMVMLANPKIKRILVALDGSKESSKALNEAIYLARECQAVLFGLYIVPLFSINYKKPSSPLAKMFLENGRKTLANAKVKAAQNGILLYDKIINGNEGYKIVSYAKNNKMDMIVIGSRGKSNIKEFFLGSVSHYVAQKSTIPVLVIK